jgi:hypothetical protein
LERLYQVQRSSDLGSGWEDVGEPTADDVMIDPVAHDKEFYRIKVLPK